jgi:16S rRNA (uracil1498-N3)-methyltransferase
MKSRRNRIYRARTREGNGEDVEVEIQEPKGLASKFKLGQTSLKSKELHLRVVGRRPAWVPRVAVHVLLATIRKERYEWVLEKCTELGATSILPLTTERSERGAVSLVRAAKIVQEAAEQCGRGNVPSVGDAQDLATILPIMQQSNELVLACVHTGVPLSQSLLSDVSKQNGLLSVLIGPEGGWTPRELELFKKHDVVEVSLGPTNLRAETAAITACALIHTTQDIHKYK